MKKVAALFLPNPFDFTQREIVRAARPMTVHRMVRTRLRHHTSVRPIADRHGRIRARREFNRPTVCRHNGRELTRADWRRVVVQPGDVLTFHVLPEGGGGGGGGSNVVGAVLAIAVAVAVPIIGPELGLALGFAAGTLGASLVTAGVGLALGAVAYGISSLFVQPPPPTSSAISGGYGDTGQISPTYSASTTGNIARLGQPIPAAYGQNLIVPDYVSAPYVRYIDNDQYVFMLLGVGQGLYDIGTPQIGNTPFSSFTDITWEQIPPDTLPTTTIADPRIITSPDISDIELVDAAGGSTPAGPFAANPPQTLIAHIEIDTIAPRGLYDASSGSIAGKSVAYTVEVQEIDDSGTAIGSWSTLATPTPSGASTQPLRWTDSYLLDHPGRWQVRLTRTDTMDTRDTVGHQFDWIGLKGQLLANRKFGGMTCLGVKAKITSQLNAQTLTVKVLATRKLVTWDPTANGGAGGMGAAGTEAATRDPCDALADILRNSVYGGRLDDSRIDLAGIYANRAEFASLGWTFDYVFDQTITTYEAASRVARAVIAQIVAQGGKLRLVRDIPSEAPVMMFSPHNTLAGSVNIEWTMFDSTTADSLIGVWMNPNTWKQEQLTVAFDDSPQENPSTITLYGVTNRAQAWAILWNLARANRYRRRTVTFDTEMEGLILLYGDRVSFSTDIAKWGQSGELIAFDAATRTATLSNTPDFSEVGTYYIVLRDEHGIIAGPYTASAIVGEADQVALGDGALPDLYLDGDAERTYYQLGIGEAYAKRMIATGVAPKDDSHATITTIDDDPRMHADLPPLPDDTVGAVADDVVVHVTTAQSKFNLRTFANANGYVGLSNQKVTVYFDDGASFSSDDPAVPAFQRGTFPSGTPLEVIFDPSVTIEAAGGAAGQAGGTAVDCTSGPLTMTAIGGTWKGGGGGGGTGANSTFFTSQIAPSYTTVNGGAGGHGQGHGVAATAGAAGEHIAGNLGDDAGTPYDYTGAAGGNGGAFGMPGAAGANGTNQGTLTTTIGMAGGAAGKAVKGLANITFVGAAPTYVGPTA